MWKATKSTGQEVCLPARFFASVGLPLLYLGHEVAHGFRRLILHLPGGVGVGTEGEACVVVAQHTGDRLDVHPVLQGQRSERMPLWHNKDKSENPVFSRADGLSLFFFHKIRPPKWRSGKEGEKAGLHIKDKF